MTIYTEELELKFENYSQLSFEDLGEEFVQLFLHNESIGLVVCFSADDSAYKGGRYY